MDQVKSYQRVFLFLLCVLFLTVLLSPWAAAFWNLVLEFRPEWETYRVPFSRFFNRFFMVLGILLFFCCRRLLKFESTAELGLRTGGSMGRDLFTGFLLAVGSMVFLGAAMTLAGIFTPYFRLPLSIAIERSFSALLAGASVGFLEEIFFRAMIFKGLAEDWNAAGALIVGNLFFAAIHFVKPGEKIAIADVDAWSGFRYLASCFAPFTEPSVLLPGLLGLFLMGAILSYAFLRTGSLYLSIGLHAGWIFGLKTIRVYGDYRREHLGWIFGDSEPKLVSGVVGWAGLVLVGLLLHVITRNRKRLILKRV